MVEKSEKKTVYGIWLKEINLDTTSHKAIFVSQVGTFKSQHSKEWIFLTNQKVQQVIGENREILGKDIGYIKMYLDHGSKRIDIWNFFPMGEEKNRQPIEVPFVEKFEKTGVGRLAFAQVLRHLEKKFPDYKVTIREANNESRSMLRKMGFVEVNIGHGKISVLENVPKPLDLHKTVKQAQDYIAREIRKRSVRRALSKGKDVSLKFFYPNPKSERGKRESIKRRNKM